MPALTTDTDRRAARRTTRDQDIVAGKTRKHEQHAARAREHLFGSVEKFERNEHLRTLAEESVRNVELDVPAVLDNSPPIIAALGRGVLALVGTILLDFMLLGGAGQHLLAQAWRMEDPPLWTLLVSTGAIVLVEIGTGAWVAATHRDVNPNAGAEFWVSRGVAALLLLGVTAMAGAASWVANGETFAGHSGLLIGATIILALATHATLLVGYRSMAEAWAVLTAKVRWLLKSRVMRRRERRRQTVRNDALRRWGLVVSALDQIHPHVPRHLQFSTADGRRINAAVGQDVVKPEGAAQGGARVDPPDAPPAAATPNRTPPPPPTATAPNAPHAPQPEENHGVEEYLRQLVQHQQQMTDGEITS